MGAVLTFSSNYQQGSKESQNTSLKNGTTQDEMQVCESETETWLKRQLWFQLPAH